MSGWLFRTQSSVSPHTGAGLRVCLGQGRDEQSHKTVLEQLFNLELYINAILK